MFNWQYASRYEMAATAQLLETPHEVHASDTGVHD